VLVTYANADGPDLDDSGLSTGKVGSGGASFSISSTTSASLSTSTSTTGATLTTNKADYQPGDTVTFTGAGFAAGDTVTITVHEDPTWSYPDRQFKSVADASGSFTNRQMIVVQMDLNVTFTGDGGWQPLRRSCSNDFHRRWYTHASPNKWASWKLRHRYDRRWSIRQTCIEHRHLLGRYHQPDDRTLVATCSSNNGGNIVSGCTFTVLQVRPWEGTRLLRRSKR
jgi:hypothetical protein